MNIRRINQLMYASAVTMIAVAVVALVLAVAKPLDTHAIKSVDSTPSQRGMTTAQISDVPPLDQFADVFAAQLHGHLAAQPAGAVLTNAAGLTLVGTIGDRVALIRSADNTEVRVVGEKFEGGEVIAVRDGEADLHTSQGIVTLHKQIEAGLPQYIHGGITP